MERESFEDEEVAQILNKHFIAIKVDREERPDVDHIYMTFCQAMTGSGGWPLTIIMTPGRKPFYAGTYFPKRSKWGRPGIMDVLESVAKAWKENKDDLMDSAAHIMSQMQEDFHPTTKDGTITMEAAHKAFKDYLRNFDDIYGGFGPAPKFPTPHNLLFLLRYWKATENGDALKMVEKTLESMYRGGIYDQIGSAFSRYSTDRKWLVPHFEKMLYDNALLAIAYLEAFQATKKKLYAEIAQQIFTYVMRDMTSPEGGFYSAEDADSEGEEGKFYVWSVEEIKKVLGDQNGEKFCELYDITEKGNFEGFNIPNQIKKMIPEKDKPFAETCRQKLFEYREQRIHPFKDDKILTAWNGLMIAAMAIGGRVLNEEKFTKAAERAVEFISTKLVGQKGRLLARYRDGDSAHLGYIDDYAFLAWGLIELYETTYKPEFLEKALKLNSELIELFWDEKNGGLFMYGKDSEALITRPKEIYDGATPSGNSVAALNFLRLARLTGQFELEEKANQHFKAFGSTVSRHPIGYSFFLIAFLNAHVPTKEIVLVDNAKSTEINKMIEAIHEEYRPFTSSVVYSSEYEKIKMLAPFVSEYKAVDNKATAYVCENFACQAPTTDLGQFREMLKS